MRYVEPGVILNGQYHGSNKFYRIHQQVLRGAFVGSSNKHVLMHPTLFVMGLVG